MLERLTRIERLDRDAAPPAAVLEEVRALLVEAEAWARVDPAAREPARDALDRVRSAVEEPFLAAEPR